VSGVYEIIAKVFANRMSSVMEKIISKPQNAFVKGRKVLDSVFIASKCLGSRIKSGIPTVLCKLDIMKAFDHINWKVSLHMLKMCDFEENWVSWISHCIFSVRFSILFYKLIFKKSFKKIIVLAIRGGSATPSSRPGDR
jgi:hypothetical protein